MSTLAEINGIECSKVVALHLDEYINLPIDMSQTFGEFLRYHLFSKVEIGKVHYINGNALDIEKELQGYGKLLKENLLS